MQKNRTKETKLPRVWTKVGISADLDYLIENIGMLIGSGMSILEGFDSIEKELRSKTMRSITRWIVKEIEAGSSLSSALERVKLFPDYTISLIRVGEESGKLSENLKLISNQQKKDRMFRSKITSALLYPIFVLSLTLIVGAGIAWFILPKLALVFSQLRIELPPLTKGLIAFGEFLAEYGNVVIPFFLFFVVLVIYLIFYFPKTKFIGQNILFYLPGTGELIQQVELARFSYLLGTLLDAGLPITRAIESLKEATFFARYKVFYAYLKTSIDEGNSFKKSFVEYKKLRHLIPLPVQQIIMAGEKSGKLRESLLKINETYEAKMETTTKNLTVILEPILLVIVWLGVVAVALAVILPIYSLVGDLNTDPSQRVKQKASQENNLSNPDLATSKDTITPYTEITPPKTKATEGTKVKPLPSLKILFTNLGYLNIRSEASLEGEIIGRAIPEEEYSYINEENGWYEILLLDDESGWVFGQYITIVNYAEEE